MSPAFSRCIAVPIRIRQRDMGTAALLDGESAEYVLGDRSYDAKSLRETIATIGATAVSHSKGAFKKVGHFLPLRF